ncbi:hypothetical protein ACVWXO_005343 [Bradyrhizobium sp. LM2.7]
MAEDQPFRGTVQLQAAVTIGFVAQVKIFAANRVDHDRRNQHQHEAPDQPKRPKPDVHQRRSISAQNM